MQWRIQTKLRPEGPKKLFWEIAPPLPYLRVRMTGPPLYLKNANRMNALIQLLLNLVQRAISKIPGIAFIKLFRKTNNPAHHIGYSRSHPLTTA